MNKMRKLLTLAVFSALLLGVFSGCSDNGSSQSASGTSGTSGTSQTETSGETASDEPITLKLLKAKAAHEVPLEQMDVFQIMSEKFNIQFEYDNPPAENFTERLNLVMVSNDLPDVICNIPMTDILKYGEQGSIVPLNSLIDNNMPNLAERMEAEPRIGQAIIYGDGNIYYFPMLDESPSGNSPYGVREDWIDALGIEVPETIEDWENYWKLVKETDLNGNGVNDEIPFCAGGFDSVRNFCSAWGVVDDFFTDPADGGKVKYGPMEDDYRDAVTWLADMYAKGYIDPEMITMTDQIYQGKMAQNLVASMRGALGGNFSSFNGSLPDTIPGFHLVATNPPVGPDGEYIHTSLDHIPRNLAGASITSANEHPERTAEWIDYMYSEEGAMLVNMGVEGKHYEMIDGVPTFTELITDNPDGLTIKQAVGTFSIGQSEGPYLFKKCQSDQIDDASVKDAKNNNIIPFLEHSWEYILPGGLSFESEPDAERRAIMADVDTYVDESIMGFITGRTPLSEWDNYVQTLKGMRIEEAIQIYQDAIDAWNSK